MPEETSSDRNSPDRQATAGRETAAPAGRPHNAIDRVVFGTAFGVIAAICAVGAIWPDQVGSAAGVALGWVTSSFGWLFILAATGFVAFALYLAFSRYGKITLGRDGEKPEFSTTTWVAMMFSAGMGIGLMFFGVAEPVQQLVKPSPTANVDAGSAGAARLSMAYTIFHWCLHPWAIYAVVGLALAYSTYRKGRGHLISSPFQAILGRKRIEEDGWGKPIDIFSIITTKFGSATSLGLGALQIAAGISLLTGYGGGGFNENQVFLPLLIIAFLTIFIVLSAVSGVSRGIKWLANTNMVLAALLWVFVFALGPTIFILNMMPETIGAYLTNIIPLSFESAAFGGLSWFQSWTIFYWAWWISWAPFVATFIARISRGRTIREFVVGVLLGPTVISVLWFVVFGGAGINLQRGGTNLAGAGDEAAAFFRLLAEYPIFTATGVLVMILTAIFFVAGADAGALVLSTLSSYGSQEPKTWLVTLWAVMTGAVAAMLLWVGGLGALQTFTILFATPFVLVIIGLCWSLYVDIRSDPAVVSGGRPAAGSGRRQDSTDVTSVRVHG